MLVRDYNTSDFEMLRGWWNGHKEVPPTFNMMPIGTSFIIEHDNIPVASISLLLTNSSVCYLENLISNPITSKNTRTLSVQAIVFYAEEFAKSLGFKHIVCFSYRDKLKTRYQELGYLRTVDDLSSFVKEI